MMGVSCGPNPPDIESLFEAERDLSAGFDDARDRVLRRACASLSHDVRGSGPAVRTRWVGLGKTAAAAIVLFALCAAAFELGHRAKDSGVPAPASAPPPLGLLSPPAASFAADESNEDDWLPVRPRSPKPKLARLVRPAQTDAYAMELSLLRPAQRAVGRLAFAEAMAIVSEHQRRFPSGQLAEEREALRVRALVGLERMDEARRVAASFRERFPHSALLGRIQALLGTKR